MTYFKDKILPSLVVALLLAILGTLLKIYLVFETLPDKFEVNNQQHEQIISLIQNEIDRRTTLTDTVIAMKIKIVVLQTKLEKK